MEKLEKNGFIKVGDWTLNKDQIRHRLTSNASEINVLYCFIAGGVPKYFGKTKKTLKNRMDQYQKPGKDQTTNLKVNNKIKYALLEQTNVDIFILIDDGSLKYGDFKLNLAAGLEDTLIDEYHEVCDWNDSGRRKIIEMKDHKILENLKLDSFEVSLGPSYYRKGFINVPNDYSNQFGAHKEKIDVYLGTNPKPINRCYIDRSSNDKTRSNLGTPRISGNSELSRWFRDNFKENDILKVDILSPFSIRLNQRS